MLQLIRNLITGWLAIVIIVVLIIPFAFWGINYYFGQGGEIAAVNVNGSRISLKDYQLAYQRIRQQFQSAGNDIAGQEEQLKQRTLDTLINRKLLSQFKDDMNLRVSDSQVRQTIMSINVFRGPDGFDNSLYTQYLAGAGYTPAGFEAQVREDMTSEQLQAGIIESAFVTTPAVENIAKLNNQTRDLEYTLVPFDDVVQDVQVSDQEVKQYYEGHDKEFMEPEKVKIAYLDLSRDAIAAKVTVSESELKSYFQSHVQNYSIAEQRKVNQILVSAGKDASDAVIDKARARADELKQELESGKSIKEIAEKESEKGPDINIEVSQFGYLAKGILDPDVDSVVFSLKKGEIGGPVRTDNSFHVVQVEDIKGGDKPAFAEVRDQVEKDYRTSKAEKQFYELAERLATLTFEHPESLEVAAEDLELPVKKSDYFSRDGAGDDLLGNPKVISAAFSEDVLQNGNNSDVIELDPNRSIVLRVVDHRPSHKKPLEEVRDDIVKSLRFEKGSRRAEEIGRQIISSLKQGAGKDALAGKYPVEWKTANGVKRDDPNVSLSVLRTAFSLGRPGNGKPVYGGTSLGSGDYAVVQVNAVHDAGTVAYEDVAPVRKNLEQARAVGAWTEFIDNLKDNADIHVFRSNL